MENRRDAANRRLQIVRGVDHRVNIHWKVETAIVVVARRAENRRGKSNRRVDRREGIRRDNAVHRVRESFIDGNGRDESFRAEVVRRIKEVLVDGIGIESLGLVNLDQRIVVDTRKDECCRAEVARRINEALVDGIGCETLGLVMLMKDSSDEGRCPTLD